MSEHVATGLETWAKDHYSTPEEIRILLESENPGRSSTILGDSLAGPTPVNAGRAAALDAILQRGRSRQIDVPFSAIKAVYDLPDEKINDVMSRCGAQPSSDGRPVIASNYLPAVVAFIAKAGQEAPESDGAGQPMPDDTLIESTAAKEPVAETPTAEPTPADEPEPMAEPAAEPAPDPVPEPEPASDPVAERPAKTAKAKPAAKTPTRRKTKFTVTKAIANDLLGMAKAEKDMSASVRGIREFLLTLPDFKPARVAVMTDTEAVEIFGRDYVSLSAPGGTLVLTRLACQQLVDAVCQSDSYYIPDDAPEADTDGEG